MRNPFGPGPVDPAVSAEPSGGAGRRHRSASARTLLVGGTLVLATVFGAALATILTAGGNSPPEPAGTAESALGPVSGEASDPLPDLTLYPLFAGDDPIALADYRGGPLVVNYWATWCAPCVEEMPDLQALASAWADRVAVVGINVRDDAEDARAFADELGVSYDLARDDDGSSFHAVEAVGMPTTLLVDSGGVVVYRHTGILDRETLERLLERHLGMS